MDIIEIFGDNYSKNYKHIRYASRGVVIKDNKILLSYDIKHNVYMLPGGGRENNETPEENAIREVREETGYIIKPLKLVLQIDEYYQDFKYTTYYLIGEIIDKTNQQLTPLEESDGLEARWIDIDDALKEFATYETREFDVLGFKGIYLRELKALKKILNR